MSDDVILSNVLGTASSPQRNTVSIRLATVENTGFDLELAAPAIGVIIGALSAEKAKLDRVQPPHLRDMHSALQVTDVSLAVNDAGQPNLVFTLQGGAELVVHMPRAVLSGLSAEAAHLGL